MNPTEQAIAEALRRYEHAPSAQVIDFAKAREQARQRRAAHHWRRPRHPDPNPPRAA
jgi:hypothetical protein